MELTVYDRLWIRNQSNQIYTRHSRPYKFPSTRIIAAYDIWVPNELIQPVTLSCKLTSYLNIFERLTARAEADYRSWPLGV